MVIGGCLLTSTRNYSKQLERLCTPKNDFNALFNTTKPPLISAYCWLVLYSNFIRVLRFQSDYYSSQYRLFLFVFFSYHEILLKYPNQISNRITFYLQWKKVRKILLTREGGTSNVHNTRSVTEIFNLFSTYFLTYRFVFVKNFYTRAAWYKEFSTVAWGAKAFSPHLNLLQMINWVHENEIFVEIGKNFLDFLYSGSHEYRNLSVDMGSLV